MVVKYWLSFFTVWVLSACRLVRGWGFEGHNFVSDLLLKPNFLSVRAKTYLADHLGNLEDTLSEASKWADSVNWSDNLHFSYTPDEDCQPFDINRDCGWVPGSDNPPRCIVTAIANYTDRAVDVQLSWSDRGEAMKFLLHLMADIHMPFHTGFRSDSGGTKTLLANYDSKLSLHELWDTNLVKQMFTELTRRDKKGLSHWIDLAKQGVGSVVIDFSQFGGSAAAPSLFEPGVSMASGIASETTTQVTCVFGYQDENENWIHLADKKVASQTYRNSRWKVVRSQLLKSALRLATLFDELAKVFYHRMAIRNSSMNIVDETHNSKESQATFTTCSEKTSSDCDTSDGNLFDVLIDFDPDESLDDETAETIDRRGESAEDNESTKTAIAEATRDGKLPSLKESHSRPEVSFPLSVDQYAVNLSLVKRGSMYVVTSRLLARIRDYMPRALHFHKVKYKKVDRSLTENARDHFVLKTIPIGFDVVVFGQLPLTHYQLRKALAGIKSMKKAVAKEIVSDIRAAKVNQWTNEGASKVEGSQQIASSSLSLQSVSESPDRPDDFTTTYLTSDEHITYFRNYFKMDEPAEIFQRRLQIDKNSYLMEQKRKLLGLKRARIFCHIYEERMIVVSDISIVKRSVDFRMKFNRFSILGSQSTSEFIFIVDRYLFDAELDGEIITFLIDTCGMNWRFSERILPQRPSLIFEIQKMADMFLDKSKEVLMTLYERSRSGEPLFLNYMSLPPSSDLRTIQSFDYTVNPDWKQYCEPTKK